MTLFRPCIDIHQGRVKQIVGGTLDTQELRTNFESDHDASWFAQLYRQNKLTGAHVIMLGSGCEDAAIQALNAWPQGLQIGGGITIDNARTWIERGASHVIVTSWLFTNNELNWARVKEISQVLGSNHLVIDLSCRKTNQGWNVSTNRWQTITQTRVTQDLVEQLSEYCAEFLIHAADVEGLCQGMDLQLIESLGQWSKIPTTYAGGAAKIDDLERVKQISNAKIDLTIGSALDLFGGSIIFDECIKWNRMQLAPDANIVH